jgi:myo-inositol-1(or 4)-monophosphatase
MNSELQTRHDTGIDIVRAAAATALSYFNEIDKLVIEQKGKQDFVSDADKNVETQIRSALAEHFPDDGIIGEEHGRIDSQSGYTWVIDPIDGTTSFINGMPGWCVVLACVYDHAAVISIIIDPKSDETYIAVKDHGATLNGRKLVVSSATSLSDGSTAVGYSGKANPAITLKMLDNLMQAGGIYFRCGSGALMLCYVAAGRLIGYCETHMNAWDCVAAFLVITEAGGLVEEFDMVTMLNSGGRVLTACPGVYPQLLKVCSEAGL